MRFKKGSKIEVLSKREVPSGSWQCAEIICGNGHNYTVRYDGLGGANVVERVSRKDIRPCPPPLEVSDDWACGDVVEVFHNFSWKMATISEVFGKKYVLVRLLGSSQEYKVSKFDIRIRQFWQDDQWIVIGKGSRSSDNLKDDEILTLEDNQNSSIQIQKTNTRIGSRVNGHHFLVKNKLNFQESRFSSSRTLKRASPYCHSQADAQAGIAQKFRVIENEGRCHRVFASNLSVLAKQADVALPRDVPGEKESHASFNIRRTSFPEVYLEKRKQSGDVGCSAAVNIESDDADSIASSVGSCSINSNNSSTSTRYVSANPVEDLDFCNAESFYHERYEEGNCLLPRKEELASEIHRLELHAYRCTIEALHASGPLSWEQEELMTNLRLSLHISNDEHLLELKNLVSADTSVQLR
ncbi:Agenet domain containing protein [Trema orientale]|uniref:Agenet domain containing protein n=1 Tax=Trema orientale TaxID=63057 RepID=A0A2P5EEX9_TREOI|nr:Agenet domain containing protein [Trema orientale]